MAELTRGNVTDRPWGRTFATLGLRGVTGQLTLFAEGKCFLVAFDRGAVVAAMSPLAADAAVRVAVQAHLVSSSQVPEISRRQAQAPDRDEIEVIAELARLGPDHALRLRRRAIAQRAARTFALPQGEFIVTDQSELPIARGCELDVRAVIYLGARTNLAEQRLSAELAQLGSRFRIKPGSDGDLAQFGFTDVEQPVVERLRDGGTLEELEGFAASFVDARTVRSVVYALAVCNACEIQEPVVAQGSVRRPVTAARPASAPAPGTTSPPMPRVTLSGMSPVAAPPPAPGPGPGPGPGTTSPPMPRATLSGMVPLVAGPRSATLPPAPPPARPAPPTRPPPLQSSLDPPTVRDGGPGLDAGAASPGPAVRRRRISSSMSPRTGQAPRADSTASHEVKGVIAQRLKLLDQGVDHFALLGVPQDVSPEVLRRAYFALARQLHPDRLAALGIPDDGKHAQRLFAQINAGFAVLSDDARRAEYLGVLRKGGEAAVRAEQARAEQLARRIVEAEDAFGRGELAVKRDQPQAAIADFELAIQLNPEEADYHALLAWARFCAAPDKAAVAAAVRGALDRAIQQSPRAVTARFYLGRVERMLGRDADAARHFRQVIEDAPGHGDAASELRVLEARMASERGGGKSGRR